MQRSTRLIARLVASLALTSVLIGAGAPVRAAQPIKVTAQALQRNTVPNGAKFVPVATPLRAGDEFFYQFDITPKNDPLTPITLNATFDQRLEVFTVGTDGACVGLYDNVRTLACRDLRAGIVQTRLTTVWVWFRVKASTSALPIVMRVTTPNDSKTITLAYAGANRLYLPITRR